jgi:hypothetical protein
LDFVSSRTSLRPSDISKDTSQCITKPSIYSTRSL